MSSEELRQAAASIRDDCPIPERSRGYDFIDYPTGFAIQRTGAVEHAEECSASQTGGVLLCDCEGIYPAWCRWRTLLAVADLLDLTATHQIGFTPQPREHLLAVARAYLGSDA